MLLQSEGTSLEHDCRKQGILELLNLEDTPLKHSSAFAIERSRGGCSEALLLSQTLYSMTASNCSKACILMRVVTLIGTVTLAAAILFRSPSDLRMGVFIIVSVAAPTLAVRSLLTGTFVWTRLFLRVLGVFTSFQRAQLSHFISIFEMATLAFFAASPIILWKIHQPVGA
jgi:hypothetical protein